MYKIVKPVFLVCETPLHAGSGDSLGVVDLPIQRERHTFFPKVEASSLKGAIRQACEDQNPRCTSDFSEYKTALELVFGPEDAGNDGFAAALGFTDARLLLFPVKSMKGVFAWITCPKVLSQFYKDFSLGGVTCLPLVNALNGGAIPAVPNGSSLSVGESVVLEEYTFNIRTKPVPRDAASLLADWLANNVTDDPFWKEKMKKDIIVLPDDDFADFVNLSTEVITRTKISNVTGTVEQGMLFTEEYLPAESVLYSLVLASPIFKEKDEEKGIFRSDNENECFTACPNEEDKVMKFFEKALPKVIQIGGNATLGKGLVRTKPL
jgi:CRISPR-associated protein Cmr4